MKSFASLAYIAIGALLATAVIFFAQRRMQQQQQQGPQAQQQQAPAAVQPPEAGPGTGSAQGGLSTGSEGNQVAGHRATGGDSGGKASSGGSSTSKKPWSFYSSRSKKSDMDLINDDDAGSDYSDPYTDVRLKFDEAMVLSGNEKYDEAIKIYHSIMQENGDVVDPRTGEKFADRARLEIQIVKCRQDRGLDYVAPSAEGLWGEIAKNLETKSPRQLDKLASPCEFYLQLKKKGPAKLGLNKEVLRRLIQLAPMLNLDSARIENDAVKVDSKDRAHLLHLVFTEADEGYSWIGVFSEDKEWFLGK